MKFFAFTTLFLASIAVARPSHMRRIPANSESVTSSNPPLPTVSGNPTNSSNPQDSLTLLSSVIASGFSQNGINSTSDPNESLSLTSTNNFINHCATLANLPITNGQQLRNGSCNPAPMGAIPSIFNMPSTWFVNPVNLATIQPNETFTIALAVKKFATGYFVNNATNYLAAPQQLDQNGQIKGHAHVVIEPIESFNQTAPTNTTKFVFYAALTDKADGNNLLYANVTGGLPEGFYMMSAALTTMNFQSVALPVPHFGSTASSLFNAVKPATAS